jgi:prevent-host-death family protein
MPAVGMRELSRETRKVVEQLESDGEPILIVRHGKPVAALVAVDGERVDELLLASAPQFVQERREADSALTEGRTRPMSEVLAEMEAAEGSEAEAAEGPAEEELLTVGDLGKGVAWTIDPKDLWSDYSERLAMASEGVLDAPGARPDPEVVEKIQSLNADLLSSWTVMMLDSALAKVRRVNQNVAELASEEGEFSMERFLEMLQGVTAAERIAHLEPEGGEGEVPSEIESGGEALAEEA